MAECGSGTPPYLLMVNPLCHAAQGIQNQ
jgi:hypothetical protein